MKTPLKTYLVRFCVRDYYIGEIKARDELDAIACAQNLYAREHEDAFEFDISRGGTDEWEAEAVKPRPNHPSNESPSNAGY